MAQIREIAAQYRELSDRGVAVVLISPQSHKRTADLAAKFDVPFLFWVDRETLSAQKRGPDHKNGLPLGMQVIGYDSDSVFPTVILLDEQGAVLWMEQTDNYRVRPEPSTYLSVLDNN
jgi:peroxiredoxin